MQPARTESFVLLRGQLNVRAKLSADGAHGVKSKETVNDSDVNLPYTSSITFPFNCPLLQKPQSGSHILSSLLPVTLLSHKVLTALGLSLLFILRAPPPLLPLTSRELLAVSVSAVGEAHVLLFPAVAFHSATQPFSQNFPLLLPWFVFPDYPA